MASKEATIPSKNYHGPQSFLRETNIFEMNFSSSLLAVVEKAFGLGSKLDSTAPTSTDSQTTPLHYTPKTKGLVKPVESVQS